MVKKNAIFFDRDGVLIKAPVDQHNKPKSIKTYDQIEWADNINKICSFYKKNYYLIMVTNQPDVTRKVNSLKNVIRINAEIKKKLDLDDIFVCYCDDTCSNRKPNPGMILNAKKKYNLDLKKCYFIGDRWRDVEASYNAGCESILLDYNYNEEIKIKPNFKIKNLKEIYGIIK